MKIQGHQKDSFDNLIYNYGVDSSLILDRTVYSKEDYSKELSSITFDFNLFYKLSHFYKIKDKEYKKLIKKMYHEKDALEDFIKVSFYFNGRVYLFYCEPFIKTISGVKERVELNVKSLQDVYKGKFSILRDEKGNVMSNKATFEIVSFSRKYKVPYFAIDFPFFFPIFAVKDFQEIFPDVTTYQYVEDFLIISKLSQEINTQTNLNKITSHGFDLKSSFRNNKI